MTIAEFMQSLDHAWELTQSQWKLLLALCCLTLILIRGTAARVTHPPGPRPNSLLGNKIPKDRQWLQFDAWRRKYGDIVKVTVMGQPTLILGSQKTASDLLDTRGNIYSDRPPATMAGELVGWARGMGYSPYNMRFREFRRVFHRFIGPRACDDDEFMSIQESENSKLLARILKDPDNFFEHARQSTSSLILRLTYGYKVVPEDDPLVKIAEDAMDGFSVASEPGAFLVDVFPILKYVPGWVPGAGFKAIAKRMKEDLDRLYSVPYTFVKNEMSRGTALPSFILSYLEEKQTMTFEDEEFINAAAASLYSGGAETTPSSVTSFILAMTLNPNVQSRGQREIDNYINASNSGELRLPRVADRPNLPYVNAIVKEVLRWNPSVPLGMPHMATEDDFYEGYYIKKGTVIWANIWSILHDETIFPEPQCFRPERYLDETGALKRLNRNEDPSAAAFGYGRRICPGLYLAENSVFLAIATILYIFNISKAKGENGVEIVPPVEYDGFIRYLHSHCGDSRHIRYIS